MEVFTNGSCYIIAEDCWEAQKVWEDYHGEDYKSSPFEIYTPKNGDLLILRFSNHTHINEKVPFDSIYKISKGCWLVSMTPQEWAESIQENYYIQSSD